MKNNHYTYKNRIPKKLQKRNRIIKQAQPNVTAKKHFSINKQLNKKLDKKTPPRRKLQYFNRGNLPFRKLPVILLLISLFFITILIPTFIVIPFTEETTTNDLFVESNEVAATTTLAETFPEEQEPALTVSVVRNESNETEEVPLETYVMRVVASEMPAEFELEALKAQALAARTYILNHLIQQSDGEQTEINDTTEHQVYKNEGELRELYGTDYTWKMDKLAEAVEATAGLILTYDDEPITPAFFSTSNGYTENSEDYWENELPYLRSVESPWDKDSPRFLDQETFAINDVASNLGIELPTDEALQIQIDRTPSERVEKLTINNQSLSGRKVREQLGLRSNDFSIQQKNNYLVFTTKGFGHGVGMSQYGANGLAEEGKTYEQIVKYYYKGVELSPIHEMAPTFVAKK